MPISTASLADDRELAALLEENRRLRALVQFGRQLTAELDLYSLLGRIVASAVELLDGHGGILTLIDRDGLARVRAVHNLPDRLVGTTIGVGDEGIIGQVLQTRAPVVVERYDQDLPHPHSDAASLSLTAGIAVPIWWQGQLIGALGVLVTASSCAFDDLDREVMEQLANHAAIAIENARLYTEVRDRLAELTGLQAASAALVEELQPERALRVVAEQALTLSAAATVSIELLRADGRELEVQVAVGEQATELDGMRIPVDRSLSGKAVATGQPQVVRAPVNGDPNVTDRSVLVLPLRARGRMLGTLSAHTRHPNAFHSRQVELLATFANQAAMSLDNARLYGELQSRVEEMVGLQRLGTLLLEEHDFDRVLHAICQQLQRLTDAEGIGLALLEDDSNFLELRTVVGPSANALRGARIPLQTSFAGEALRSNRPQRSEDAQHDPRGNRKSLVLGNTRTILSVPMKTRQRAVGVLSIYNKQGGGGFTDRDAELATFFANQAAAAIENARLYEQTRQYAVVEERNRLARELHDSVTQSLFSITLLCQAALNLWDRDPDRGRDRLERANELATGALAEMRALIFQLRPMALQEEGLVSALTKHLAALGSRHGVSVELRLSGRQRRLPAIIEEAAFRIVQESLNNVVKHARTSRARVELQFEADRLRICTSDLGAGFNLPARHRPRTMGLVSMRERAEVVGGHLNVQSAPGQGTRVLAELPIPYAE